MIDKVHVNKVACIYHVYILFPETQASKCVQSCTNKDAHRILKQAFQPITDWLKVIYHSYNHCWCISFLGRCFGFAAAMECCSQRCAWSFGPKWLLESLPAYGLSWPGIVKGDIWWDPKWPLIWGSYSVSAVFLGVRHDKVDQTVGIFAYLSTYSLTYQWPG